MYPNNNKTQNTSNATLSDKPLRQMDLLIIIGHDIIIHNTYHSTTHRAVLLYIEQSVPCINAFCLVCIRNVLGDGYLTREEFDNAPWRLEGDQENAMDIRFIEQEIVSENDALRKIDTSKLLSKTPAIEQIRQNIALLENALRKEVDNIKLADEQQEKSL